jgi:hypothetical protein
MTRVDLYYGKANALLRRAALSTLLGGAFGLLLLGALVFVAMQKVGPGRLGWAWLAIGALATLLIAWCWRTYRQLARVRVTEAGFELVEGRGSTLVPWHSLEEIEIRSQELRIRAAGQRPFAINFRALSNIQPLMDIISAKKPAGVRLIVGNL